MVSVEQARVDTIHPYICEHPRCKDGEVLLFAWEYQQEIETYGRLWCAACKAEEQPRRERAG